MTRGYSTELAGKPVYVCKTLLPPPSAFRYLESAKSSGLDGLSPDSLISRSILSLPRPLNGSDPKVHISHMRMPKDLEKEGWVAVGRHFSKVIYLSVKILHILFNWQCLVCNLAENLLA